MTFRLIRALKREPVDRTPVWLMRQAGRYLPEYRAIREKIGHFLGMCKHPEIAAEITLQPLARFELDAAIIFSDILTIPDAMGLGLSFKKDEGPHFEFPIRDQKAVDQLLLPDPEEALGYVMQAIRLVKKSLKEVPLIGFCGSPWTVATYMVEGKGSRTFGAIKTMMYQAPEVLKGLLVKLTDASILYLKAQIAAGADVIMIFDTWGGILTLDAFRNFSLSFMQTIVTALRADLATQAVPIILFTKQGGGWLEMLADTGCDALGLDWTQDIGLARQRVGDRVALQGNLDPAILYGSSACIQEEVKKILMAYGKGSGHVFNLGHGILPDVSPEKVKVMIETVHQFHAA